MRIDCHVHAFALRPENGKTSAHVIGTLPFRFMSWRLGIRLRDSAGGAAAAGAIEDEVERKLAALLEATPQLDAAVVLAFDAAHDRDGRLDEARTHLYVTNDHAIAMAARHPKMLFGASVHPYRRDAVAELERCVRGGAVLMKWLPIAQDFDPSDPRCFGFYEALAHHRLPLLSHTGGEKALPNLRAGVADPMLLRPALDRGVTVIAAHCGTRSAPGETDFVPAFMRLAHEYEHFYGDTAALNLPMRSYAYDHVLRDRVVRDKLVHGSDWPVMSLPPASQLGVRRSLALLRERNWLRRDCMIKELLGFDEAYWQRAGKVLKLTV